MENSFRERDYTPLTLRRRDKNCPPDIIPNFPHVNDWGVIRAKCPKCGRITSIRVCYGCKELMCEDCLIEHQVVCLHKEKTTL